MDREYMRRQAEATLELTKGFTPEQRQRMGTWLETLTEFSSNIIELTNDYYMGEKVMVPSIDLAPFKVKGIMEGKLLVEGDFSGGTHNVCQSDWIDISLVEKKWWYDLRNKKKP